jgi:hypothetical protein
VPGRSRAADRLVVEAPLAKLRKLKQLQEQYDKKVAQRRAQTMDVFAKLGFTPNCKVQHAARVAGEPVPPRCGQCPQERFVDLPDEDLDVLYGGAGGGGKSHSLLVLALRACIRYPGIQVFWFRRSFPELNQSVLRLLARFGHARSLGASWNGSSYELRFPGGSVLTFAHAKNLQEASALSSAEINLLILDERTTIAPDVVNFLYTRVRSGVPGVPCLGIRSASNPGFVGHRVVKEGWVDATDYGRVELVDKAGRRRIFIPAKIADNPFIGDYEATLQGIEDPELRRRIAEGDWSVMPDQAFPDWRRDRIAVPAFDLPASWLRYGGLDWGWTAPSVYLLAARDNDGRLWYYRELVMRQTPEQEQARRVLAIEDVAPIVRAADPAMWGKNGSALPPASQFAIAGTPLRKADNDRFGGKQRLHQYLAQGPACAYHRSLGWDICPMLHVIETGCPELLVSMETLPRDPKKPEDVDTNADDHAYDAARYLAMAVGIAPQMIFDEDKPTGELVQRGAYGYRPEDLTIPAERPEPGVTPGVATGPAPGASDPWSQV